MLTLSSTDIGRIDYNVSTRLDYSKGRLNRWWKTVYIRSFHLSVLLREYSPSAERLHSPSPGIEPNSNAGQAWAAVHAVR
jgi:hypothetical protein